MAAPASVPYHPRGAATAVWIVALLVVAAAVGALGFYAGYEYRGSPAASPGTTLNSTLSVLGAGTLDFTFPEVANALVNETPGLSAPTAAQTYEGSLDITGALAAQSATADVAALADFRLVPQLLQPTFASWEIVFAQTQEVLIYNPGISGFHGINSTNWGQDLVRVTSAGGNDRLGVWNASTDPNGYNEIFSVMLQGELYNSTPDVNAVYGHFYSGAEGTYATPNPATTILEHESQAANLVQTGLVSAVITYKAVAVQSDLPYVLLDPIVGLGSNTSSALADYTALSTKIINSTGELAKVVPAPILFVITIPSNAPNAALGALFIHLLLSPQGSAILAQDGAWTPIFPGWSPTPKVVPGLLRPDVTALPAWAPPFIP